MTIKIKKETIFGKPAWVVFKNGKATEFRYTKKGAENLANKLKRKYFNSRRNKTITISRRN